VTLPSLPGFELAAHYSPFRLIGGDYYDALRLDEARLLIAIADVSGKGTGAAILTANLQAILHVAQLRDDSLETVAKTINASLAHHTESNRFVTMVLAVLDLGARRLRYVNAGHNPPLGVTSDGSTRRLEATGLPLGMFGASTYTTVEVEIPAGTVLLFYTDGLSERANPLEDLYGEERILAVLREARAEPAERIIEAIIRDADRFSRGAPPEDDTAMLLLKSV
jgi:sigma-B regulation protein RsbU (phosphoserine phosphatase)